jgi:hypothetical protein
LYKFLAKVVYCDKISFEAVGWWQMSENHFQRVNWETNNGCRKIAHFRVAIHKNACGRATDQLPWQHQLSFSLSLPFPPPSLVLLIPFFRCSQYNSRRIDWKREIHY